MNERLSRAALAALRKPGFEVAPGYCLRWVRQVVQAEYGWNAWQPPLGLDAAEAMEWFLAKGLARTGAGYGQIGDILFYVGRGHSAHGHVGIRVPGNLLAENSTLHWRPWSRDARGTRNLFKVGMPSAVVSLRIGA